MPNASILRCALHRGLAQTPLTRNVTAKPWQRLLTPQIQQHVRKQVIVIVIWCAVINRCARIMKYYSKIASMGCTTVCVKLVMNFRMVVVPNPRQCVRTLPVPRRIVPLCIRVPMRRAVKMNMALIMAVVQCRIFMWETILVERVLLAFNLGKKGANAIVHQWSMNLTRPTNAAAIVICTADNGSIHAQAMETRKNTKKRIMYVIVIAIKILNMM